MPPAGWVKPVVIVVTVQGIDAVGVTIETEEEPGVQKRAPSKTTSLGLSPRLVATVVTAPAGWEGSMRKSLPGEPLPARMIFPIAGRTPCTLVAPVQVSSSLPSLARTRETVPPSLLPTQISTPSVLT